MLLLSHPTGSQFVREALRAFDERGWLKEFCTPLSWRKDSLTSKILPAKVRRQCERRSYSEQLWSRTRTRPFREGGRMLASSMGWGWPIRHEVGPWSIDAVCRSLDSWVARRLKTVPDLTAVYAYEDAAQATFEAAKRLGLRTVYEHPVGYWRDVQRLFQEELELNPEYAGAIAGIEDSVAKRERKDREIAQADLIVVPSSYSARTLQECPTLKAKIEVVNYGAPTVTLESPPESKSDKLRVMFVGSLQQRKGISYVVDACNKLKNQIEVTAIGSRVGECKPLDAWLSSINWIPSAPHSEVLENMRRNDVLVLPSLSEGFGLVVLEAMSQGMTVLVSENTGAGDVAEDGVEGFVVPIRSSEAIAEKLEILIREPERRQSMREAALKKAKTRQWDLYREELANAVGPMVEDES